MDLVWTDLTLIPNGVERCSLKKFSPWMIFWLMILAGGFVSAFLCLFKGLSQTNMNNNFPFGLWIVFDLSLIALGAGAFFLGLLTHIVGKDDLKAIISPAVIIGFICYSAALAMLGVDIGQPLRGWFIFRHPNFHSMLTEVSFCITLYLCVLTVEYIPLIFSNKKLSEVKEFSILGGIIHNKIAFLAIVGTVLSFFHQGSLGGMFGVLFTRPFAFREGIQLVLPVMGPYLWPWTFFLFILSAVAAGPSFTLLCIWLAQKVARKQLVKESVFNTLAKISGWLLASYIVLKVLDTVNWACSIVPKAGLSFMDFYQGSYGLWLVVFEVGVFGIIPAIILITPLRKRILVVGALMTVAGVVLNRFVFTIQTLAIPVMPFDKFMSYLPSWQEWGVALSAISYGVILFSLSHRYLPLFPQEAELNPVKLFGKTVTEFGVVKQG